MRYHVHFSLFCFVVICLLTCNMQTRVQKKTVEYCPENAFLGFNMFLANAKKTSDSNAVAFNREILKIKRKPAPIDTCLVYPGVTELQ